MSSKTKTIVRVSKRENPYVTLDKFFLSDERLSWKAKGLLSYLLSKPDNWEIYISDLIKRATDGRDSIYAGLKELEIAGYLKRNRKHNEMGRFDGYEYVIYERPQEAVSTTDTKEQPKPEELKKCRRYTVYPDTEEPYQDKPYTEKPYTGKPYPENPTLLNNDITYNDSTKERQQHKDLNFKVLDYAQPSTDNKPSVVVNDSVNQSVKRVLEAFWGIAERRESDIKFIEKLLGLYTEEEILEEIRKIDYTYPDKSQMREPKALLTCALRIRFDEPRNYKADVSEQIVKLRNLLREVSVKRFGMSFDAKLQLLAELGYRFSPKAVEAVRQEFVTLNDKYKDVYQN